MSALTPAQRETLAQVIARLEGDESIAFCTPDIVDAIRAALAETPQGTMIESQHRAERAEGRLREISELLADAGVPGGTTIYNGVLILRERAERAEHALACPGRDPLCPCQDGDSCHYRDTATTKAMPIPAGAPPALVALVQEWQAACAAYSHGDTASHERVATAERALMWWPEATPDPPSAPEAD